MFLWGTKSDRNLAGPAGGAGDAGGAGSRRRSAQPGSLRVAGRTRRSSWHTQKECRQFDARLGGQARPSDAPGGSPPPRLAHETARIQGPPPRRGDRDKARRAMAHARTHHPRRRSSPVLGDWPRQVAPRQGRVGHPHNDHAPRRVPAEHLLHRRARLHLLTQRFASRVSLYTGLLR